MKIILVFTFTILLLAVTSTDKITGRWESKLPDGNILGVIFKSDNSMEGYFNKKPLFSGTYAWSDSIFSFEDNGCGNIKGIYKIVFFSNSDSMHWEVVNDSCEGRRRGMNKMVFGRVK
ncbi:MAG TPA: hypothetical protein VH396_10635 [Chitinophagaceae bacterium]|jgi:hypothetical protein